MAQDGDPEDPIDLEPQEDADVEQKELARRIGVTRNVIANLETGRRILTVADFVMIARALNVSADTLLRRVLQW